MDAVVREVNRGRERLLRYAMSCVAVLVCYTTGVRPFLDGMNTHGNDFDFLTTGVRALAGDGPYHYQLGVFYPPGALAVFYPLRSLSPHTAAVLNLLLGLVLCGTAVWMLGCSLAETRREPRRFLLIVMALLWAPLLAGLHSDNVSVPLIGLLLMLCSDELLQTTWLTGLLLGLTLAVKPQLGIFFLVFLAVRRRWVALAIAVSVAVSLTLCGVRLIGHVEPRWMADYLETQRFFNGPGQWADVSYSEPRRYLLLNLQVALYPWLRSVPASRYLGMAVAGVLVAVWLAIDRRARLRNDRLALAALLPIALVGIYHLYYDGALLLLCLSAVLMLRRSPAVWSVFALLGMFLVRPAPIYRCMPQRFLDGRVASPLWNSLGVGFSACLTLAVVIAMLWLYWRWTAGEEGFLAQESPAIVLPEPYPPSVQTL